MYVKVVYIVTKCHKKECRYVKKNEFCDKMSKKNGRGDAAALNM